VLKERIALFSFDLTHEFGSRLKANSEDRVLTFMTEAGFADPKKVASRAMFFGNIAYYRAIA
jgi:hypothetical protein